jgi:hypothetical protein
MTRGWLNINNAERVDFFLSILLSERQVASLTKIMTCLTTIHIIEDFKLNPKILKFTIHKNAIKLKGTTANLKYCFDD